MATKLVNGIRYEMTDAELTAFNQRRTKTFEEAMQELRAKRNRLLAETDYLALSDQTLSADMNTYRQQLRDITDGLTTVEDVNSVTWPTKPGA